MQLIQTPQGPRLAKRPFISDTIDGRTSQAAVTATGLGRYDMILMAAARLRELHKGHARRIASPHGDLVVVIQEIEGGHVPTEEYFLKASRQY